MILHQGIHITNGTQDFRRSKSSNAYEDRSQPHRAGRDRDLGFFRDTGEAQPALNPTTNYGEGSYREHGV